MLVTKQTIDMKQYKVYAGLTLALSLLGGSLSSCDKDEDRAVVNARSASTLTLSSSNVAIDANTLEDPALTLSWTKADLGYEKALLGYDLLISQPGRTAVGDTLSIPLGAGVLTKNLSHKDLNTQLTEAFGVAAGTATEYHLQLRAYPYTGTAFRPTGTSVAISEPQVVRITTAVLQLVSPNYFLVGDFGATPTWTPSYTGFPFFREALDSKEYTYTGYFKAGSAFKFMGEGLDWGHDLGKDAEGTLKAGGANIELAAAGYYMVKFNPTALSYSVEVYDATSATEYNTIALIGDAVGGWDADMVPLTKSAYDPHVWRAENVTLGTGGFKFRANGSWDKNWGGTFFPVGATDSGENIMIEGKIAGAYDVMFNDLTGHYHFLKR